MGIQCGLDSLRSDDRDPSNLNKNIRTSVVGSEHQIQLSLAEGSLCSGLERIPSVGRDDQCITYA